MPAASRALWHPSPNFSARRGGGKIELIVLHYTVLPVAAALERLCSVEHEVSAHYLIDEAGGLTSLVPDHCRAWHAGAGKWGSISDVNSASIGIEIENDGKGPFSPLAMTRLKELLATLMRLHHLSPERVIGHSDLAPCRKTDPGPHFPWRELASQGLSVWPSGDGEGPPPDPAAFISLAQRFGYTADPDPDVVLSAFRLRFRPFHDGPLDDTDMRLIAELARRWPVDEGSAQA